MLKTFLLKKNTKSIYDLDSFVPSVSTHIYKENYFNEQYQDLEFSFNPDLLTPEVISSYFNDNGSYQLKKKHGRISYIVPLLDYYNVGELRVNSITIKDDLYDELDSGNYDVALEKRLLRFPLENQDGNVSGKSNMQLMNYQN